MWQNKKHFVLYFILYIYKNIYIMNVIRTYKNHETSMGYAFRYFHLSQFSVSILFFFFGLCYCLKLCSVVGCVIVGAFNHAIIPLLCTHLST